MAQAVAAPVAAREVGFKTVDAATLKGWLERGEAVLVDVREPAEHAAAHIPGSRLMPLSKFDCAAVQPKDGRKLVLHCQSGMRAGQAAKRLLDAGCTEVYCFEAGVTGWQEAGYAVESTGKAHLSVLRQTQLTVGAGDAAGRAGVALVPDPARLHGLRPVDGRRHRLLPAGRGHRPPAAQPRRPLRQVTAHHPYAARICHMPRT
ncbi:MAG: rhodanese-like domain-containing protein [Armatimonadetes bacterium]|nr:rhodanese-like domain-containing protein [Armatimonadota bacterium]